MRMATRAIWLAVGLMVLGGTGVASAAETATEKRLRILEQQLRKAQEEIDQLRGQVQQQKAVGQATQKQAEDAQETAKSTAAQVAKGPELPDWTKRTTVFGDVRFRHEGFYHQPSTIGGTPVGARNRERIRARLGVRFAFSDEISATIRGATGNINDPISTNETLTGDFNRKNFNLDWAFLTFSPGKSFGIRPGAVNVTAGKFPVSTFKVGELVFDEDLSAEGLAETFQLLDKPVGALDQVKLHALQWTFNEIGNHEDAWMFGGQVNPSMHFGTTQLEFGLAQYWWLNPDQIPCPSGSGTLAAPCSPFSTNSVLKGSNTNLVGLEGVKNGKPVVGYLSGFNESNATVGVTLPNVVGTMPLRGFADYVYNWDAATDDAHGWQAGLRLGQTKVKDDWSIYGLYEQLEQEAVISAFTWSDLGNGGTNVEGPVAGIDYQLLNPLTVSARGYFTNQINRTAGLRNPTLMRMQLDAIIRF
jgi:hypothetical protein